MPDILVYIKSGANEELRYAIRTWQKNLEFDRLCVVGGPKPDWLVPDIYIENPAHYAKMRQCYDNLIKALSDDRLTDDIILLMDDVFIINYVGEWDINYNRGTLQQHWDRAVGNGVPSSYDDQVMATNDYLEGIGIIRPLSFEEHAPFLCNRHKLLDILNDIGPKKMDNLLYRSIYGNIHNIDTKFKLDYKIVKKGERPMMNELVVSTNETSFRGSIGNVIKSYFPEKSKYEK